MYLEGHRRAGPPEVVGNRVAQEDADIAVLDVPRRVPLRALRHQILPGAFRDHDHRVASPLEPLLQRREEPFEAERHFGNQAEVHLAVDQGRIRRDEPRIAAHDLHESDPVARRLRLGVCCIRRAVRLGDGRLESKRPLHERDVVVDRLGDTDDADLQATSGRFLPDLLCPAKRPVATNGKEDPDTQIFQGTRPFPQRPAVPAMIREWIRHSRGSDGRIRASARAARARAGARALHSRTESRRCCSRHSGGAGSGRSPG